MFKNSLTWKISLASLLACMQMPSLASDISAPLDRSLDETISQAFTTYLNINSSLKDMTFKASDIDNLIESATIEGTSLHVNFNRALIEKFIEDNKGSMLSAIEDPVLMWFVNIKENSQQILTDSSPEDINSLFLKSADLNSMRIMFPLMDLDDIQTVNASTILSHNDAALSLTSKRYGSDFYIAGAIAQNSDNTVSAKFNVCTKDGISIHSAEFTGQSISVISALMHESRTAISSYLSSTKTDTVKNSNDNAADSKLKPADLDPQTLGPGQDFVRIALYNICSLSDLISVRDLLISYGYDDNAEIIRINPDHIVFELKTNAHASILDGTMKKAGDFEYISPWSYALKISKKKNAAHLQKPGPRSGSGAIFISDLKHKAQQAPIIINSDNAKATAKADNI